MGTFHALAAATLLTSYGSAALAFASDAQQATNRAKKPSASAEKSDGEPAPDDYWTPERLKNAKPMPLPAPEKPPREEPATPGKREASTSAPPQK